MNNDYGHLEAQKAILGILKGIHKFCEENDIRYCLDGGSVLGAIRHGGFIPWDDDADIAIKREEFKKLWALRDKFDGYRLETGIEKAPWVYRIRTADDDEHQVDVFIYDNIPDSKAGRKMKVMIMSMLQGMLKLESDYAKFSSKQKAMLKFSKAIGKPFSRERKLAWYDRAAQISDKRSKKRINTFNATYRALHRKFDADTLDERILWKFEDTELYIMKKYDYYLTVMYGENYMEPPKEQYRATKSSYLDDPDVYIPL